MKDMDILQEIYQKRNFNISGLARHFATSRGEIQRTFDSLVDHGQLEEVRSKCSTSWACRSCPMKNRCNEEENLSALKIYRVTEKGQQAISGTQEKGVTDDDEAVIANEA